MVTLTLSRISCSLSLSSVCIFSLWFLEWHDSLIFLLPHLFILLSLLNWFFSPFFLRFWMLLCLSVYLLFSFLCTPIFFVSLPLNYIMISRFKHIYRPTTPKYVESEWLRLTPLNYIYYYYYYYYYYYFVVDFVIHWYETGMGLHVFPILIPPPTSLSTRSL